MTYFKDELIAVTLVVLLAISVECASQPISSALPPTRSTQLTEELAELVRAGEYEKAEDIAEQTGIDDPFFRSWLLIKQGRLSDATGLLEQASKQGDFEGKVHAIRVLSEGSLDAAANLATTLKEGCEPRERVLLNLVVLGLLTEALKFDADRAERLAMALVGNDDLKSVPDFQHTLLRLSNRFAEAGSFDKALYWVEKVKELAPEKQLDPSYHLQWINTAAHGNASEALERVNYIRSRFPEYAEENKSIILLSEATAHESLGDYKKAAELYKALVNIDPKSNSHKEYAITAQYKLQEMQQMIANQSDMRSVTPQVMRFTDMSPWGIAFLVLNIAVVLGLFFLWALKFKRTSRD